MSRKKKNQRFIFNDIQNDGEIEVDQAFAGSEKNPRATKAIDLWMKFTGDENQKCITLSRETTVALIKRLVLEMDITITEIIKSE